MPQNEILGRGNEEGTTRAAGIAGIPSCEALKTGGGAAFLPCRRTTNRRLAQGRRSSQLKY